MQKASRSEKSGKKLRGGYEPYLLNLASTYIDCCQHHKAKAILEFLAKSGRLNKTLQEQHMLLQTMVFFKLSDFKRSANLALKLYKQTTDEQLQVYLLLTINKCFIAMNGPTEAKKYLKAYLKKLKKT